jgi:adenosylcobinamide-GDP ribazoletransferase
MADALAALVIAFSLFTFVPMPALDWTPGRRRFVPMWLPLVGLFIGAGAWGLFLLLSLWQATPVLKAVLLTLYFPIITGGMHTDGMMDAADAYFSRRDRDKKLEIMKDSRIGAFAAMALVAMLLLKTALFTEAFSAGKFQALLLLLIPVLSRAFQSSMIYLFPYAKGEGLAAMYGREPDRRMLIALGLFAGVVCAGVFLLAGPKYLAVPGVCALYYIFFYFSSKKQFGGITGDVLGSFLELSELLMLAAAILI